MALCTWDPAAIGANITLSNGNLTWASTNAGGVSGLGTVGYTTGQPGTNSNFKLVYEVTIIAVGSTSALGVEIGLAQSGKATNTYVGGDSVSACYECTTGDVFFLASVFATYFTSANADVVMAATDFFLQKYWVTKDGVTWNNDILANQNPATGAGGFSLHTMFNGGGGGAQSTIFPAFGSRQSGPSGTGNFGATAFTHPIPTGFTPWNSPYDPTQMMFLLSP